MGDKHPCTLQSYIDTAAGAAQSVLGSLTGSTGDKAEGEAKKDKAQAEKDASHATLKLPGVSASSSGAVTKDDPNRQEGAWNQTIGSGKEFVGGLIGSEDMKKEGREQNLAGQGQEAQGQLNDLSSGISNRVSGAVGGAVAGLTGEKEAQAKAQEKQDIGNTQQRGAEHDIQKQSQ